MFVHLAVDLLFRRLFSGVVDDQPMSTKGERARCGQDGANGAGFTSGGVAQLNTRAGWLNTYTCLTDLVTGQFTVERLIANTLLDRPDNPMLSHAGD